MILRRLAHLVVVLFFVTLFVATLTSLLPGDPVDAIAGFASPEQKEALREELRLDDPVYVQYGRWLGNFVTGDLGNYYSVTGGRPVMDRVRDALPVSLQLMVYAQVLALVIAIPLGVFTAYRAGSRFDKAANATAFGLLAIPNFAARRSCSPTTWACDSGGCRSAATSNPARTWSSTSAAWRMPAIALAVGQIAVYMRLLRSDMIATLQEDFIRWRSRRASRRAASSGATRCGRRA